MKQVGWLLLISILSSCSTINVKRNGYYQTIKYKTKKEHPKKKIVTRAETNSIDYLETNQVQLKSKQVPGLQANSPSSSFAYLEGIELISLIEKSSGPEVGQGISERLAIKETKANSSYTRYTDVSQEVVSESKKRRPGNWMLILSIIFTIAGIGFISTLWAATVLLGLALVGVGLIFLILWIKRRKRLRRAVG